MLTDLVRCSLHMMNITTVSEELKDSNKYFTADSDWEAYARDHGMSLKLDVPDDEVVQFGPLLPGMRAAQAVEEGAWLLEHPVSAIGYEVSVKKITMRDGVQIEVQICRPIASGMNRHASTIQSKKLLPLLFVCHGGGWINGTHITEQRWLLQPLMKHCKFVSVSVGYRLAPEHPYPCHINDCWDAFKYAATHHEEFGFDKDNIIVAGSSAGAAIAATISQKAQVSSLPLRGVLLNVPVLCDFRHWPAEFGPNKSYKQSSGTVLSAGAMRGVWTLVVPEDEGKSPLASPLLGNVAGLPPHVMFIAGQDPLRDEALAYGVKLRDHGVVTSTYIYPGVPHIFSEIWELRSTQKYQHDLVVAWKSLLQGSIAAPQI